MPTHVRVLFGALTAAFVLAGAIGTASARNLSVSNQNFRIVWTPLTYATASGGGGTTLSCNVTLEGSFHYRTIIKQLRVLIGFITKAATAHPCAGAGEAWSNNGIENTGLGVIPTTLPWPVSYEAFTGRLPTITGLRILYRPFLTLNIVGTLCVYSGNIQAVLNLNASGEASTITPDATIGKPKISGGILCPATLYYTATSSSVTLLNSAARITITLI